MTVLKFSDQAKEDLKNLAAYTLNTWGEDQLQKYREQLKSAFVQLSEMPKSGRPRDDIRSGYRSLPVAEHVIFYRLESNGDVQIIAIPHSKRDPSQHMTETS